jgi:hypothetical protein
MQALKTELKSLITAIDSGNEEEILKHIGYCQYFMSRIPDPDGKVYCYKYEKESEERDE